MLSECELFQIALIYFLFIIQIKYNQLKNHYYQFIGFNLSFAKVSLSKHNINMSTDLKNPVHLKSQLKLNKNQLKLLPTKNPEIHLNGVNTNPTPTPTSKRLPSITPVESSQIKPEINTTVKKNKVSNLELPQVSAMAANNRKQSIKEAEDNQNDVDPAGGVKNQQQQAQPPVSPRKIINRYVPIDCQTAMEEHEFNKIGAKIMTDVSKILKLEEKNSKTIHQLMLKSIEERVNDLNMTNVGRRVVRKKKKNQAGGSFLKMRRAASIETDESKKPELTPQQQLRQIYMGKLEMYDKFLHQKDRVHISEYQKPLDNFQAAKQQDLVLQKNHAFQQTTSQLNKSQSKIQQQQSKQAIQSQIYIMKIKTNEAQPLNIDLKIDMDVQVMNQRYGIQAKDKFGDIIVDSHQREHLQKIVEHHYRKNGMRDWEEALKEVQKYYSVGDTATLDQAYLKEKYKKIRDILNEQQKQQMSANASQILTKNKLDELGSIDIQDNKAKFPQKQTAENSPTNRIQGNQFNSTSKFSLKLDAIQGRDRQNKSVLGNTLQKVSPIVPPLSSSHILHINNNQTAFQQWKEQPSGFNKTSMGMIGLISGEPKFLNNGQISKRSSIHNRGDAQSTLMSTTKRGLLNCDSDGDEQNFQVAPMPPISMRRTSMLSKKGSVSLMNDNISQEEGDEESQEILVNEETHEEMVLRHKDLLMDIFNIYNNYLFDQAEHIQRMNPSPSNRSALKNNSNQTSQQQISHINSQQHQKNLLSQRLSKHLSPNTALEYDIEMFGNRHPDFIGAILVKDQETGTVYVANKKQYDEVQKLFNEYYNYMLPNLELRKVYKRSFKNMTLKDFEQLATKKNILKFDIETQLSKHLNRILLIRKDDPFLTHRHQVYLRHKLEKASERLGLLQKPGALENKHQKYLTALDKISHPTLEPPKAGFSLEVPSIMSKIEAQLLSKIEQKPAVKVAPVPTAMSKPLKISRIIEEKIESLRNEVTEIMAAGMNSTSRMKIQAAAIMTSARETKSKSVMEKKMKTNFQFTASQSAIQSPSNKK